MNVTKDVIADLLPSMKPERPAPTRGRSSRPT